MKPLGIKAKVALATSITSILMIALVTVVQMQRVKQDFAKLLYAQQTALITHTAEELDDKLASLLGIVAFSARNQPPEVARSADSLRAYYQDRAVLSLFDDLVVFGPDGKVIGDLPMIPGRIGIDLSDRDYFRKVMYTRKPMITEPLIGKYYKEPIVQMVAPVLDARGEVVCVLVGVLRLYKDNFLGHLRRAKVGGTGFYFALTRGAHPVYVLHPDSNRLLKPREANANPTTTRALEQGFEGTVEGVDSDGVAVVNSYKALKSVDWLLAASLPADEAFEPFNGLLTRLLVWGGLASVLTALLIGWLASRMLAPLVKLRNAITALRGNASQFTALPVPTDDEVGQLTAAFNNLMRERLAADARLQSVLEFAPNAIIVVGMDGRIETINREAERCFGYRREDLLGELVEVLVPMPLRTQHTAHRENFFAERLSAEPVRMGRGAVLHGRRQDGSEFPLEINLSAVRTDQGTKVLAVISDITEPHRLRTEAEARAHELEQERDRAEAANRAKSEFVANMSHEIRTPMNAVLGMVYLLGNTQLTQQQRKYLNMVRVSGQSLLGILNDVLDYSKIEARHMELSPVEFNLDDTMNSLATTMTMNVGDKELELAIAVDPDVPKRLRGDALRLHQILVNLAGNAIKFTAQGEVVVAIALSARDDGHALLRFEVRDTGIGMTEQQMSQLFNAFSQGDQSITRRFGGTGLGLAITKRLIELMGGQIAVDSVPGKGSRFWFSLPFDVLPERPDERRKPAIGDLRLLVADDNITSRELIAKLIRAWGWQADEVDSGVAAIARFEQSISDGRPYDVVLADWHMPGMDGLATTRGIRAAAPEGSQPVVVMVNAFARDRLEEISGAPEVDVVLVKPITSSNLFDALHEALANNGDSSLQVAAEHGIQGTLDGYRFLLVEDNVLNQAVARGMLELAGAVIDVVDDGQQAVDRMSTRSGDYDLVLMDMQMPVMDGFTATGILRQELKLTLPVIAMTAGVLESERDRSVGVGITDFIPKPIEVEEMLEVLLRHLPKRPAPVQAPAPAAVTVPERDGQSDARSDAQADAQAATPAPLPEPALSEPAPATPTLATTAQHTPPKLVASPPPAGEATVFNVDSLMRVMGKDAKGRAVMIKMVRAAIDGGMAPVEEAGEALSEGRLRDAARQFHSLRGAVGVLGARRLIQATIDAEDAINNGRSDQLEARYQAVRSELEATLADARTWLEQQI